MVSPVEFPHDTQGIRESGHRPADHELRPDFDPDRPALSSSGFGNIATPFSSAHLRFYYDAS